MLMSDTQIKRTATVAEGDDAKIFLIQLSFSDRSERDRAKVKISAALAGDNVCISVLEVADDGVPT
jgi:hypothetical protein